MVDNINEILFPSRNEAFKRLCEICKRGKEIETRVIEITGSALSGKSFLMDKLFGWVQNVKFIIDFSTKKRDYLTGFKKTACGKFEYIDEKKSIRQIFTCISEHVPLPAVVFIKNFAGTAGQIAFVKELVDIVDELPMLVFIEITNEREAWLRFRKQLITQGLLITETLLPLGTDEIVNFISSILKIPEYSVKTWGEIICEVTDGNAKMVSTAVDTLLKLSDSVLLPMPTKDIITSVSKSLQHLIPIIYGNTLASLDNRSLLYLRSLALISNNPCPPPADRKKASIPGKIEETGLTRNGRIVSGALKYFIASKTPSEQKREIYKDIIGRYLKTKHCDMYALIDCLVEAVKISTFPAKELKRILAKITNLFMFSGPYEISPNITELINLVRNQYIAEAPDLIIRLRLMQLSTLPAGEKEWRDILKIIMNEFECFGLKDDYIRSYISIIGAFLHFSNNAYDKALTDLDTSWQKARLLPNKQQSKRLKAFIWLSRCFIWHAEGNYPVLIHRAQQMIKAIANSESTQNIKILIQEHLAVGYGNHGKHERAISVFNSMLQPALIRSQFGLLISSQIGIAVNYISLGRFSDSLNAIYSAEKYLFTRELNPSISLNFFSVKSLVYRYLGLYEEALSAGHRAVESSTYFDTDTRLHSYRRMVRLLFYTGKYNEANELLKRIPQPTSSSQFLANQLEFARLASTNKDENHKGWLKELTRIEQSNVPKLFSPLHLIEVKSFLLSALGKYSKALEILSPLIVNGDDRESIARHLAIIAYIRFLLFNNLSPSKKSDISKIISLFEKSVMFFLEKSNYIHLKIVFKQVKECQTPLARALADYFNSNFYLREICPTNKVYIYVLGKWLVKNYPFEIDIGPTQNEGIASTRPLNILAEIIIAHIEGKKLTWDQIAYEIWGDISLEKLRGNFHTNIMRLRRMLTHHGENIITKENHFYILNPEINIYIDIEEFEKIYKSAHLKRQLGQILPAIELYKKILDMYWGTPFPGVYTDKVEQIRERIKSKLADTVNTLVHFYWQTREHNQIMEIADMCRKFEIDIDEQTAHIISNCKSNLAGQESDSQPTQPQSEDITHSYL